MTDMFAGRIYSHERQPSRAVNSLRKLLGREGERERALDWTNSVPASGAR